MDHSKPHMRDINLHFRLLNTRVTPGGSGREPAVEMQEYQLRVTISRNRSRIRQSSVAAEFSFCTPRAPDGLSIQTVDQRPIQLNTTVLRTRSVLVVCRMEGSRDSGGTSLSVLVHGLSTKPPQHNRC